MNAALNPVIKSYVTGRLVVLIAISCTWGQQQSPKVKSSHTAPARGRACGEVCWSEPGLHAEPEIGETQILKHTPPASACSAKTEHPHWENAGRSFNSHSNCNQTSDPLVFSKRTAGNVSPPLPDTPTLTGWHNYWNFQLHDVKLSISSL